MRIYVIHIYISHGEFCRSSSTVLTIQNVQMAIWLLLINVHVHDLFLQVIQQNNVINSHFNFQKLQQTFKRTPLSEPKPGLHDPGYGTALQWVCHRS